MAFVTKNLRSTVAGRQTGSSMVNRRSAVVAKANNPLGTDTKGKTITGTKDLDSEAAVSQRAADTKEYLNRLPGQGPRSGPFSGVWDPANLTVSAPIEDIRRWRESEITHGRVAMLASVGFIVQEQLEDNNLFLNWDGHIRGQAIHQFDDVQAGFSEALLISIGLAESYRVSIGWANPSSNRGKGFNHLKDDYELGNLYFDPLGLKPKDETELFDMQSKELNNGRLAMIAIAIFTIQELAQPGVQIFDHWFANAGESASQVTSQLPNDLPTPNLASAPKLPNPQDISNALPDGPKLPSAQELANKLPNAPNLPSAQDLGNKAQDLSNKLPSPQDLPSPPKPNGPFAGLFGGPKQLAEDVKDALPDAPKLPSAQDVKNALPDAPKLPSAQDVKDALPDVPKLPEPEKVKDLPTPNRPNFNIFGGRSPNPPPAADVPDSMQPNLSSQTSPSMPNIPKITGVPGSLPDSGPGTLPGSFPEKDLPGNPLLPDSNPNQ